MPPPSIGWSYVRPAGSKLQACDSTSWQPDLISYLVLHHHGTPSAARDQQPGESADQPLPVARPQGLRSNPKPNAGQIGGEAPVLTWANVVCLPGGVVVTDRH